MKVSVVNKYLTTVNNVAAWCFIQTLRFNKFVYFLGKPWYFLPRRKYQCASLSMIVLSYQQWQCVVRRYLGYIDIGDVEDDNDSEW